MKVLITENKFKDILKLSIKDLGVQSTIDNVGGWENFCKALNIESPIDFLKSLPKMEEDVESRPDWVKYYYEKGRYLFSYDTIYKSVWVNYDEIWQFLRFNFNLDKDETKKIVKEWLSEVYNLETREIQTFYDDNRRSR